MAKMEIEVPVSEGVLQKQKSEVAELLDLQMSEENTW